jgi:Protein of unknown function (DUF4232)
VTRVEEQLPALLRLAAPESKGVSVENVARRVRRRRRIRWSLAAGSAATLAVVAALVAPGPSTPSRRIDQPTPTPPVDLSGTVPWIDAPAQRYQPPPSSPRPPPATNARPCRAADVAANWAGVEGAGGHTMFTVRFRNTSETPCVLKGYPHVLATEPGLPNVTGTESSFFPVPGTANMLPGQVTFLGLESDTYCDARPDGGDPRVVYHRVVIDMPGGGTVTLNRKFDMTCGLRLTKFFVNQEPQPEPHDPLADLEATIQLPDTVNAGTVMTYVVELSNPTSRAIDLQRCPSYVEVLGNPSARAKETYALNCAPVDTIQPSDSVRFEMRIQVPSQATTGQVNISWSLAGPGLPTAAATIHIAQPSA